MFGKSGNRSHLKCKAWCLPFLIHTGTVLLPSLNGAMVSCTKYGLHFLFKRLEFKRKTGLTIQLLFVEVLFGAR